LIAVGKPAVAVEAMEVRACPECSYLMKSSPQPLHDGTTSASFSTYYLYVHVACGILCLMILK